MLGEKLKEKKEETNKKRARKTAVKISSCIYLLGTVIGTGIQVKSIKALPLKMLSVKVRNII